jgi:hypothetical protein
MNESAVRKQKQENIAAHAQNAKRNLLLQCNTYVKVWSRGRENEDRRERNSSLKTKIPNQNIIYSS